MTDWKVGDLAVCVNDSPCPYYGPVPGLTNGMIYRVIEVRVCPLLNGGTETGLKMDRHNPVHPQTGAEGLSAHTRFRKIEPAEPVFIEAMRNLRIKEAA